jgi:hypothetical protein
MSHGAPKIEQENIVFYPNLNSSFRKRHVSVCNIIGSDSDRCYLYGPHSHGLLEAGKPPAFQDRFTNYHIACYSFIANTNISTI